MQTPTEIQKTLQDKIGRHTAYYFSGTGLTIFGDAKNSQSGLLIFSDNDASGLAETISQSVKAASGTSESVAVLLHKPKSLKTTSKDQQWFFDQVIRFGYRMTLDSKNPPYLNTPGFPERDLAAAQNYWNKCDAVANQYLDSAMASQRLDVELVKTALLTTAAEYATLGLIRLFMGYTPNRHSLKFLFAVSETFTDLHLKIFESDTERGQRCLKRLFAPPNMLRHWDELKIDESDYDFLESACENYLAEATKLALTKLEELNHSLKTAKR